MSINSGKSVFKNKYKSLLLKVSKETDPERAIDLLVNNMADIIGDLIKSGEVNFSTGTVKGTTPSGGGALVGGNASKGKIN